MWFSVVGGGTLGILLSAQCRERILSHREGPAVGCQLGSRHFYCGSGNHIPMSPLPGDSPVPMMCPTCRYFPPPARHRPSHTAADACTWGCVRLINSFSKHQSSCHALSMSLVSFKPRKNCIIGSTCKFLLVPQRVVSTPGTGSLNPDWQDTEPSSLRSLPVFDVLCFSSPAV